MTKDEFLDVDIYIFYIVKKLPKHVIKNGKIIPIRSEIAKKFDPKLKVPDNARIDQLDGSIIILTEV